MLSAAFAVYQTPPLYRSSLRLLDQVREVIRRKHYSIRTEDVYCDWVRRYVRFCDLRHPQDCGAARSRHF